MTRGQKFEETFKKVALDFIKRKNLKKKSIAEFCWPNDAKPDNKIQRIMDNQGISLADAFQLAESFNYDFIDWMKKVLEAFEKEESENPTNQHRNSA